MLALRFSDGFVYVSFQIYNGDFLNFHLVENSETNQITFVPRGHP